MGRGVSSGGGQSSLGYLFGSGESPKPTPKHVSPSTGTVNEVPQTQNEVVKETPPPAVVPKDIPAGIPGNNANNYFRADGQNCGNFLTDRPTTKVHAAPGGGSSLDYLFGGNPNQNDKIKNILNQAREDHTQAVKTRITSVQEMAGVVDITKSLFEVSKETARVEAESFELEQKTALAAEAKAVLDSWVRYESQIKARQQKETADYVIAKATKELTNPKALQEILRQSVAEVEKIVAQAKA